MVVEKNSRIVIDVGKNEKTTKELETIIPALKKHIDILALSHAEEDHAGGVGYVFEAFSIGAILMSYDDGPLTESINDMAIKYKVPIIRMKAGDSLMIGGAEILILWPTKTASNSPSFDTNDTSLILQYNTDTISALFLGDVNCDVERVVSSIIENVSILKVAHHGSRFSSDIEFLEKIFPNVAIISVGKNSYGHPTDEVLGRLASVGANIFRTDTNGTIKIVPDNSTIRVFTTR